MNSNQKSLAIEISRSLGVPIFPTNNEKRPLTPAGHNDATAVAAHIEAWWDSFPNANFGMPTGAPSGIVVIDLDGGEKGEQSFAKLGPINQETIQVRTQSGGRHLWYLYPAGKRIPCDIGRKLGAFIDVKGDGGYVLIPPSSTDIGRYEFIEGYRPEQIDIAPLPQIVIEKLTTPSICKKRKRVGERPRAINLDFLLRPVVEGSRDVELTSRCGYLINFYGPRIEVLDLLKDINRKCCLPPLPERQVEKIFNSIRKREVRHG